jgi:hypothetical protein
MDEARIRELTEEVLGQLRQPSAPDEGDVEARLAAIESAVRELRAARGTTLVATASVVAAVSAPTRPSTHPSFQLLGPAPGGGGSCVMEPDKPCVNSGACRTFGH